MENQLDTIQKEFFNLYKKIESEELVIESLSGDKSKWSTSAMFNLTPLHIERSRGNLFYDNVYDSKPNNSRITQAILSNDKIVTLKNWNNNELIGLSVFSYLNENEIKQTSISVDDDEQELRSIIIYNLDNNKIVKKTEATIYGALIEKYIYENNKLIKIQIDKKIDMINEVIDTDDGITNVPINSFSYLMKYQNNSLVEIIGDDGKNIYHPENNK